MLSRVSHGALFIMLLVWATASICSPLNLKTAQIKHLKFKGLKSTVYQVNADGIEIKVDGSASALIIAFDKPVTLNHFSFKWKKTGILKVRSSNQEASKKGDDAYFRFGLLQHSKKPLVPFFAPSWVKAVSKFLKLPSDKLIYYFVGAQHNPGTEWSSPYNSDIKNRSVMSKKGKDGYLTVSVTLLKPIKLSGLWLMSDGDNTNSNFSLTVKELRIE